MDYCRKERFVTENESAERKLDCNTSRAENRANLRAGGCRDCYAGAGVASGLLAVFARAGCANDRGRIQRQSNDFTLPYYSVSASRRNCGKCGIPLVDKIKRQDAASNREEIDNYSELLGSDSETWVCIAHGD